MRSIRIKIMLATFLVVYVPIYLLNRYSVRTFDEFTRKALEEEMIGHARLLGEQYRLILASRPTKERAPITPGFARLVRRAGTQLQTHLAVVSPAGRVLVDSEKESLVGENISELPEIAKAMTGRYGARWAMTPDRKRVVYYIALPVRDDSGAVLGIAYVTQHTGQIHKAIVAIERDQKWAMSLALVGGLIISAVVAQTLTRRLRRLTRAARDYARGQAPLDLSLRGHDEIGELSHAVTFMAGEIEKRNAYNKDFINTTTHELRTPLTIIKGAAEVLRDGEADSPEAERKFTDNILIATERMSGMVDDLHELTKLDTENVQATRELIDYGAYVEEAIERLEPTLSTPHARIELTEPDAPARVYASPPRIDQVLANLIENAVRYTPPDGTIAVTVTPGPDGAVTTSVQDTGQGIAPTNIDRVFDRFFTTEPKGERKPYGSGLGLAIVKAIVENHRGEIRVESERDKGACFTFTLPTV